MNGPHDMGGMQCYGPVLPERDEPLFHRDWERRALSLSVAMGACGMWNIDMARRVRERIEPARYLASSYYEIWTEGLATLLKEQGMATANELTTGKSAHSAIAVKRVPDGAMMAKLLAEGAPVAREASTRALFAARQKVRARDFNPPGHTRLPRYVRGKPGVIETVAGCHVFPDGNAHGKGEDPRWLYTVRFAARDLFGPDADPAHFIHVDCWEPYLEAR